MTEERAKCCANCRWWIESAFGEDGWCGRDGLVTQLYETCLDWEKDEDQPGEEDDHDEEEDDDGP